MSKSRLFVKPKEGLEVQKLFSEIGRKENIKKEGEYMPNSLYYRRLIKRGELIEIKSSEIKSSEIKSINEAKTNIKFKTRKV